ncbi:hypothetical protein D7X33_27660 [Butyricicoccus sp. 1XD8-22]|nr:hypothetical protein D7X33_27660 [Butyricicoccus sp. 1XD8-22]
MNYQVQLNNGQIINLTGVTNFNAAEFTKSLNDRAINFINFGNAIINKNIIIAITPVVEKTEEES